LEVGLCDIVEDRVMFSANIRNIGGQFITEIRLHQQDTFLCDEFGLFLLNTDGPNDIDFQEHTFQDPGYFRERDRAELSIFFKGTLKFIVNNFVVTPGVVTDIFEKFQSVVQRKDAEENGLRETPDGFWMLVGTKNLSFYLDLPRKTSWVGSSLRLRLRLGGFLLRNSTLIT
jgi:hypothetical protein